MLVSAMRSNEFIEMRVIEGRSRSTYLLKNDAEKQQLDTTGLLNSNNNNNILTPTTVHSQQTAATSGDDLSDMNSLISPFDTINQQKSATSYPNIPFEWQEYGQNKNRGLSGSVPTLATGLSLSNTCYSFIQIQLTLIIVY